jgi:aryl-alcohol dehydrogenase-like predicted oxidoreductase
MPCQHFGVGSIPWSPLARGLLCRPSDGASTERLKTDMAFQYLYRADDTKNIVDATETVAKARGVTMAQVALAWVLSKDQVSAPIVGTTSLDNLYDLISTSLRLSTLDNSADLHGRGYQHQADR